MDRVPTVDVGVLGVVLSDPEVIAVFPELSSTILPHAQEIRFYRGDSLDIAVQAQNDGDPADKVTLTDSVLRWAAKQGHGNVPSSLRNKLVLGNEAALLLKTSADPEQIEITSESNGQAIVHLTREDTYLLPTVPAVWGLELVKATETLGLPVGNVLLTPGSDTLLSVSPALDWTKVRLRPGDLVRAQGRTVRVLAIDSAQHLRVDWSDWTGGLLPSSGPIVTPPHGDSAVYAFRAKTKTVAYGAFVALGDVVR